MIENKCIKGAQGVTLYRMTEISFRCEIHGANTCTEIGTPADRLGTMVPREVGGHLYATNAIFNGIYNTQPKLFRMAAAQFWRSLAVVLGSCPEPEMVQNGTETNHLENLGGLGPERIQNGIETDHLEHLGGLGPERAQNGSKNDHME